MPTAIMPEGRQRYYNNDGTPCAGGKLYTYAAGTTALKPAYTDEAGAVAHPNPITLDAHGEAVIYWSGAYKVDLKQADGQQVTGYPVDNIKTDPAGIWGVAAAVVAQFAASAGSSLVGFLQTGAATVVRTVQDKLRETVTFEDFGAKGDGVTDDTAALQKAINSGKAIRITDKTFCYTALTGLARDGLTLRGYGSSCSVLKCTGTGNALNIDAFASGGASDPFVQGVTLSGFTVHGNPNIDVIWNMRGVSRSKFKDINLREANNATGIGGLFSGCMLNRFTSIMCSQDRQAMASPPSEGFRIQAAWRAGVSVGGSSNNVFLNLYAEGSGTAAGMKFGVRLVEADQNLFLGGSPESCYTYGLLIGTLCRMNTFEGMGFENLGATADVADAGTSSKFINCYSSQSFIFQGKRGVIDGGIYERVEIQAGADRNTVQNITLNHWATGDGGFVDNGTGTRWRHLYDEDAGAYIYPYKDRTAIPVNASPSQWKNTTGGYVQVVLQSDQPTHVTQVRILRGTDSWLNNISVPHVHLVAPNDTIEVSYSLVLPDGVTACAPPQMSQLPINGL